MANDYHEYYQNNQELLPVLKSAETNAAWIILTYHNIDRPGNWGWYQWDEFIKDLDYIQANDFWAGNMDDIACYIHERNTFRYEIVDSTNSAHSTTYAIEFSDQLNNESYSHPLTLKIKAPSNRKLNSANVNKKGMAKQTIVPKDNQFYINVMPDENVSHLTLYFE